MKRQDARRMRYAWILIMVFVPMLLLSLTHTHGLSADASVECQECLHHVHHSHFGVADTCIDNCVLCQMLTMVFTPATALAICAIFLFKTKSEKAITVTSTVGFEFVLSGRAPPQHRF